MRSWCLAFAFAFAISSGCSSHVDAVGAAGCPERTTLRGESCVPDVPSCDDRSIAPIGSGCVAVGVPSCAEGFDADGRGGCTARLPSDACKPGELALLGDASCHPVADCGSQPYPPGTESAIHVDASYSGASDGSVAKPYSKIADAILAAPADGTIAIAAGSYTENLLIQRSLHLVGRCPSMVSIAGAPDKTTTYTVDVIADATVSGVAVTGPYVSISVRNGKATLDHLWVHDSGAQGVDLQMPTTSNTEVTLRDSLVEGNHFAGILVLGAHATIERVVSRKNLPEADGTGGAGLQIGTWKMNPASRVDVRASIFEDNTFANVAVAGVKATIDGSVLRRSVAEPSGKEAPGLGVYNDPKNANVGDVTLSSSLVEENRGVGIYVLSGKATIDKSVVRAQKTRASDDLGGDGITAARKADLTVRDSLVEGNRHAGILISGSTGVVERCVVRDTTAHGDGAFGVGVAFSVDGVLPSQGSVEDTLIARSRYVGLAVVGSAVTAKRLLVRETAAQTSDGKFGDGIAITAVVAADTVVPASFDTSDVTVDGSARAAMSLFGAALTVERALLACSAFPLEVSEDYTLRASKDPRPFALDTRGDSHCGCGATWEDCRAYSSGLDPVTVPAR
ncbi:MAG: right-handed parallel beta-helix repeat-containing protein [Polyangiales bacterium]